MLSIISNKKSFDDRWIGSALLNRYGLHRGRMLAAQACVAVRQSLSSGYAEGMREHVEQIVMQGFAVLENYLPAPEFESLSSEVEGAFAALERERPIPENEISGFGAKQNFPGGFDRHDGGTLNRFLTIDHQRHPGTARFATDERLDPLTMAICGKPHAARNTNLYLTVNGSEQRNADLQKVMHRDTYFSSMKYWYFLHPVTSLDGPFTYVPCSHLLTPERLDWEEGIANLAAQGRAAVDNQGGSFRISAERLSELGLAQPVEVTCPANTLVIANTLGFHRRGDAIPGSRRLAIYGWRRPYPFGLLGL